MPRGYGQDRACSRPQVGAGRPKVRWKAGRLRHPWGLASHGAAWRDSWSVSGPYCTGRHMVWHVRCRRTRAASSTSGDVRGAGSDVIGGCARCGAAALARWPGCVAGVSSSWGCDCGAVGPPKCGFGGRTTRGRLRWRARGRRSLRMNA